MNLSVFKELYNHHHNLILEHFHRFKKKCLTHLYQSLHVPTAHPQPDTPTESTFSKYLPRDNIMWWDFTTCALLRPASFTEHSVFEIHPCCSMYQHFLF